MRERENGIQQFFECNYLREKKRERGEEKILKYKNYGLQKHSKKRKNKIIVSLTKL